MIQVSATEFQALKHIHQALYHGYRQPTSRSVAAALGFTSSRTGYRMINALLRRGLIYRTEEGNMEMSDDAKGCEPRLVISGDVPI